MSLRRDLTSNWVKPRAAARIAITGDRRREYEGRQLDGTAGRAMRLGNHIAQISSSAMRALSPKRHGGRASVFDRDSREFGDVATSPSAAHRDAAGSGQGGEGGSERGSLRGWAGRGVNEGASEGGNAFDTHAGGRQVEGFASRKPGRTASGAAYACACASPGGDVAGTRAAWGDLPANSHVGDGNGRFCARSDRHGDASPSESGTSPRNGGAALFLCRGDSFGGRSPQRADLRAMRSDLRIRVPTGLPRLSPMPLTRRQLSRASNRSPIKCSGTVFHDAGKRPVTAVTTAGGAFRGSELSTSRPSTSAGLGANVFDIAAFGS